MFSSNDTDREYPRRMREEKQKPRRQHLYSYNTREDDMPVVQCLRPECGKKTHAEIAPGTDQSKLMCRACSTLQVELVAGK